MATNKQALGNTRVHPVSFLVAAVLAAGLLFVGCGGGTENAAGINEFSEVSPALGIREALTSQMGEESRATEGKPVEAPVLTRTLSVTVVGNGMVQSSPVGIACSAGTCTASYPKGTTVTLTASPGSGWTFSGWTTDCAGSKNCAWGVSCTGTATCTITVDGNKSVTATFGGSGTPPQPTTTTSTQPAGAWATKAEIPTPRQTLGMGVINGVLYAVGGYNGSTVVATLEAYDPATNTWRTKAPMPTARTTSAGVVNGLLYAVGGTNSSGYLATLEAYDPTTDTWTTKAPMPTARTAIVGVVNGILYAVGGSGASGGSVATLEAYDPLTDTWTTKAPMPTRRVLLAADAVNGILYAVGGHQDSTANIRRELEAYDPATNTWTTRAPMPTARFGVAAGVINGLLYAVGGCATMYGCGSTPSTALEAYDPTTNAWTTKTPMSIPRQSLAAGVVNGLLYAVGGNDGRILVATIEVYTPSP